MALHFFVRLSITRWWYWREFSPPLVLKKMIFTELRARYARLVAGGTVLAMTLPLIAAVRLPAVISDHMVLQADQRVPIWGWARPHEKIAVDLDGQKLITVADSQGKWRVRLEPLRAGQHLTLTVEGVNKVVVRDVLIGEVWLGGGQSNMGLHVSEANRFDAEKAAADFPEIRMFTVELKSSAVPLDDCAGRWEVCSSTTVGNFSAALYFFGRELHQRLKTPVGLIHSSWGGTPIHPWISLPVLKKYPGYTNLVERKKKEIEAWPARKAKLDEQLKNWETAAAKVEALHQPAPPKPWNPGPPDSGKYMPGQLYNAMICPLIPYGIRGAIWYQGEANAGGGSEGAADYADLCSRLISSWRSDWGRGDFPFIFTQLPGWNNDGDASRVSWAYFREGQAKVLALTNTGMAVTIDIGEKDNIHPKNKQDVGHRLALVALANTYRQNVICSGPQFAKVESAVTEIKIHFLHAEGGLTARGSELKGFVVAGSDKKWHTATARIVGDVVIASCQEVPQPVAVRYAWANNPDGNLFNAAGLPAAPFRSCDW